MSFYLRFWGFVLGLGLATAGGLSSAAAQSMDEFIRPGEAAGEPEPQRPGSPAVVVPAEEAVWSADYRLGPGDVVFIEVYGAEEYSGEVIVLQDGTVNLPRVGRVAVEGYTLETAADAIATYYVRYIRQPLITLSPVRLRPVRIAIAGEVNRPGSYNLEGTDTVDDNTSADSSFPTLTQAIAEAGGITSRADLRGIEIRRPVSPEEEDTARVNLWDLIQSGDLDQDVILQSGDEVYIPTATALTSAEAVALSDASFAPENIQVYIAGEVDSAGVVRLPLNTTLNQAILAAGSFNRRANTAVVELVRVNPDGTATQRRIPVDFSLPVNAENNPILVDQDVIVVNRSNLARIGDAANTLLSPVTRILNTILGLENLFD